MCGGAIKTKLPVYGRRESKIERERWVSKALEGKTMNKCLRALKCLLINYLNDCC